ncbi:MAG: hypothetical protein GY913_08835 [Proteobacteria bacterium]|nr:hypothetical protein [Pseudomonadota bacterium]
MTVLFALLGCSNECTDVDRISGTYEVFSSVTSHAPDDVGDMPTYAPFYNGSSTWTMSYIPASGNFNLLVDGQELDARYLASDVNCNRFQLKVPNGDWTADISELGDTGEHRSDHSIAFEADLIWQGGEMSGHYTATDDWSTTDGASGTLEAQGTISATLLEE